MTIRSLFLNWGWKIQRVITPGLRDSQYEYRDAVASNVRKEIRWLDLGCGHHSFGGWMAAEEKEVLSRAGFVTGLDYEFASVRRHKTIQNKLAGDVYHLPIADGAFDLITANMVMEHFADPAAALVEIRRTLTDRGILIFHTPNILNYQFRVASLLPQWIRNKLVRLFEGRSESDVFPTHYKINSRKAIERLAAQTGYAVRTLRMVNSSPETYILGPFVFLELLIIRLLTGSRAEKYRSNIIAILEKYPDRRWARESAEPQRVTTAAAR